MNSTPETASDLSSHIAANIRDAIIKGVLIVDERLPSEAELSAQFNVSRATVREAGLRATLRVGGFEPALLEDIEALPSVQEVRAAPDGRHTRLDVQLRDDDTSALASALVGLGLKLYSVEPKDTTLEGVFLARTEAHD